MTTQAATIRPLAFAIVAEAFDEAAVRCGHKDQAAEYIVRCLTKAGYSIVPTRALEDAQSTARDVYVDALSLLRLAHENLPTARVVKSETAP